MKKAKFGKDTRILAGILGVLLVILALVTAVKSCQRNHADAEAETLSAKDVEAEKAELTALMAPIGRDFVRWVLTGSPTTNPNDVCIPTSLIKFKLKKPTDRYNINIAKGDFDYISFEMLTIEECIDRIMYKSNGTLKPGGFNTGLSWTYATGSKGQKMQFKG